LNPRACVNKKETQKQQQQQQKKHAKGSDVTLCEVCAQQGSVAWFTDIEFR
jgi:hypothetical protein